MNRFSHEYVHQWNVKRLRPKLFLDYDLQREVNTDLLWWFEGATSWIGDIMCLRSGAWSAEDYFADMKRKLGFTSIEAMLTREKLKFHIISKVN